MDTFVVLVSVLLIAFVVSFRLMGKAGEWAERLGMVDRPRRGEVQARSLPRTGGYVILVAFLVAAGVSLIPSLVTSTGLLVAFDPLSRYASEYPRLLGLLLGAVLIVPLAILDDRRRLSPLPQFIGQAIIATIPIMFGVVIDSIASPFGGIVELPGALVIPITLIWFLGMMNTLNFIDTMDGIAGGVATIAGLILVVRSIQLEQYSIAALVLALIGACVGFLPHNLYPSRIIMGTCGSMFLGYTLAALAILGGAKIATTSMVLALPILDTGLVILHRMRKGSSPFKGGDAAHLPHRLLALGLSQRMVAYLMYAVCLTLGVLSLALSALQKLYTIAGGVLLLAVIGFALFQVGLLKQPNPSVNPAPGAEPAPPPRT